MCFHGPRINRNPPGAIAKVMWLGQTICSREVRLATCEDGSERTSKGISDPAQPQRSQRGQEGLLAMRLFNKRCQAPGLPPHQLSRKRPWPILSNGKPSPSMTERKRLGLKLVCLRGTVDKPPLDHFLDVPVLRIHLRIKIIMVSLSINLDPQRLASKWN